ncbi:MAG: TIGR03986 family CRISPR-associated RAMP protein [Chloroflexi bacterium OHK40]
MPLPKHIYPVPEDREALAPYNFVPLPERVVLAQELPQSEQGADPRLPRQDSYLAGRHTGRLVCSLVTETPLYVRCGYTPQEFAEYGGRAFYELTPEQQQERARFFAHDDPSAPVIPGSSLRGMLRSLVEVVAYGKMGRVFDRQLFYRSVADRNYQRLFVEDYGQVQVAPNPRASCYRTLVRAGYLCQRDGRFVIEECDFARIDHHAHNPRGLAAIPLLPGQPLMYGHGASRKPNWTYQHRRIYVVCDATDRDYFFQQTPRHPDLYLRFRGVRQASFTSGTIAGAVPGTLVITGHMQNKHMEFVFLQPNGIEHPVDPSLIERFEDDDQITQWQESAFERDRPTPGSRRADGLLRDGEPVFFLLDANGSLRFFGRAQLFRLPYGTAPYDFLPQEQREDESIDIAEALFGFVRQRQQAGDRPQTGAGRVFVGDAQFVTARDAVWLDEITPRILAIPKPTTYQHYLVQPHHTGARRAHLLRYDSTTGATTLRGHKLYWHRGAVGVDDVREHDAEKIAQAPKQFTRMKPVQAGVTFRFDVHFENLSDVELGALLWVLRLCDDTWQAEQKRGPYRFALGMGKPFGMGSVQVRYELQLSDRARRYSSLASGNTWTDPSPIDADKTPERAITAFEEYVLHESGEQVGKGDDLHSPLRMRCFLALLSWPGPDRLATRYMEIERDEAHRDGHRPGRVNTSTHKVNEYSERLVLPLPTQVLADHPPPRPAAPPLPPEELRQLDIGVELTGQRRGEITIGRGRGVRVDLNLRGYMLPKGKTLVGFIPRKEASGGASGGFRGNVVAFEADGSTIYLILQPALPTSRKGDA